MENREAIESIKATLQAIATEIVRRKDANEPFEESLGVAYHNLKIDLYNAQIASGFTVLKPHADMARWTSYPHD